MLLGAAQLARRDAAAVGRPVHVHRVVESHTAVDGQGALLAARHVAHIYIMVLHESLRLAVGTADGTALGLGQPQCRANLPDCLVVCATLRRHVHHAVDIALGSVRTIVEFVALLGPRHAARGTRDLVP